LADGTEVIAASIHAPPRRAEGDVLGGRDPARLRRSVEGPKFNDATFAGLAPLVEDRRFILGGDWNTARHQGTVRASKAGERFFARVREAGWYDCVGETLHGETVLGLSRSATYESVRRLELPSVRIGRRILIPTARLAEPLGAWHKGGRPSTRLRSPGPPLSE
jgi:hypothetical protein